MAARRGKRITPTDDKVKKKPNASRLEWKSDRHASDRGPTIHFADELESIPVTKRGLYGRKNASKYPGPGILPAVKKLAELGATIRDIADYLADEFPDAGIDERLVQQWVISEPDFNAAVRVAKDTADWRVEQSLYRRALGYTFDSVKIFERDGLIYSTPIREHVPPDVTAAIFWLKNRKRAEWNTHNLPLTEEDGGEVATAVKVEIKVARKPERDRAPQDVIKERVGAMLDKGKK